MRTLLFSLFVIVMLGCNKNGALTTPIETNKPEVKIIAPVTSQYFKTDDPLCFKGNVLAQRQLVVVRLKLYKEADMITPCLQFDYYTDEKYFELDKKIIVPSYLQGSCRIEFEAVDVTGKMGKAVMGFSSN
jgi:hypothetical protein